MSLYEVDPGLTKPVEGTKGIVVYENTTKVDPERGEVTQIVEATEPQFVEGQQGE